MRTKRKITRFAAWILAMVLLTASAWAVTLEKSGGTDVWFSISDFTALCGDAESPLAGIVITSLPQRRHVPVQNTK